MKVRNLQVQNLESLFRNVIVDVDIKDSTVTLNRIESTAISFSVPDQDYSSLLQGDKGDQGETGDSAYQVYRNSGGYLSEVQWLSALKGAQGEQGDPGDDGTDGINGVNAIDPIIEEAMIAQDDSLEKPLVKLLRRDIKNYLLNIKIPTGRQGEKGNSSSDEQFVIKTVNVKDKGIPYAKVENSGNKTYLDFSFVKGSKGEQGDPADTARDGIVPDIQVTVNMISEDKVPAVSKTVVDNQWYINLDIPRGKQGSKGDQGKKGLRADLMPDVHYCTINESHELINAPSVNSFKPFSFTAEGKQFFGWSVKDSNNRITQCAFSDNGTTLMVRTKENGVFGSVNEGWVQFADIIRIEGD